MSILSKILARNELAGSVRDHRVMCAGSSRDHCGIWPLPPKRKVPRPLKKITPHPRNPKKLEFLANHEFLAVWDRRKTRASRGPRRRAGGLPR